MTPLQLFCVTYLGNPEPGMYNARIRFPSYQVTTVSVKEQVAWRYVVCPCDQGLDESRKHKISLKIMVVE